MTSSSSTLSGDDFPNTTMKLNTTTEHFNAQAIATEPLLHLQTCIHRFVIVCCDPILRFERSKIKTKNILMLVCAL